MEKLTVFIDQSQSQAFAVARLRGALDMFSFKDFRDTIERWAENRPVPVLFVDMGEISYVGSSGWSSLLLLSASMERKGGRLVAFAVADKIRHSLDMITSKRRVMNIVATLQDAIKSMSEPAPAAEAGPSAKA